MYYIVNKETKEHRVRQGVPPKGWYEVEADDEGWIKWEGGECPLPHGELCDVRHRRYGVYVSQSAGVKADVPDGYAEDWKNDSHSGDIIAYRPACYHEHKEEDVEWNGEGLPPAGTECEYYDGESRHWVPAAIVAHHINGGEAIWSSNIHGGELFYGTCHDFRPIRTPEQRAVDEMADVVEGIYNRDDVLTAIYTAIREGRIPGVKLEEKA